MGGLLYIKRQSSCLVVLPDLQAAGLVWLELHLEISVNLAISILNKSDGDVGCRDLLRVKSVGKVMCRGSVARTLEQQSVARDNGLWEITELLNLINVPAHYEDIYDQALKSGLVILVLQGEREPLRQGCHILEDLPMGKLVLYLV